MVISVKPCLIETKIKVNFFPAIRTVRRKYSRYREPGFAWLCRFVRNKRDKTRRPVSTLNSPNRVHIQSSNMNSPFQNMSPYQDRIIGYKTVDIHFQQFNNTLLSIYRKRKNFYPHLMHLSHQVSVQFTVFWMK